MFDSLHLLLIFMLPLLLSGLKTFHLGLVTGLFLSLLYWGVLFPPLVLIPLSAAVVLGFRQRQLPADFAAPTSDMLYIRKPAQRLFMAFLVFMVIFCALGDTVYLYGTYIKASGAALRASDFLGTLGLFAGPVSAGIYCDRKGPFKTAVALTFIAELGTGFAAFGGNDFRLWLTGCFLLSAVISGFFTLVPLISLALIGPSHFLKIYPEMAVALLLTWTGTNYFYSHSLRLTENPGDLLITLIILPLFAVFSIVVAWQHRFVLVAPAKLP